jgi:carbon storage regulator
MEQVLNIPIPHGEHATYKGTEVAVISLTLLNVALLNVTALRSPREESAMLVLTRKLNESVIIDGGIEIMVVAVRGNKVRLGFRAPAEVAIQRSERVSDDDDRHGMHRCVAHSAPAGLTHG